VAFCHRGFGHHAERKARSVPPVSGRAAQGDSCGGCKNSGLGGGGRVYCWFN
jgi:hypothetical protein